jgi:hypothetical protein
MVFMGPLFTEEIFNVNPAIKKRKKRIKVARRSAGCSSDSNRPARKQKRRTDWRKIGRNVKDFLTFAIPLVMGAIKIVNAITSFSAEQRKHAKTFSNVNAFA